jgi:hypothetical protein
MILNRHDKSESESTVLNPLPGVPKVESPFFNRFFKPGDPDYLVAKSLNETGYAILDFEEENFDDIAKNVIEDLDSKYDWSGWGTGGLGPRIAHAYKFSDSVKKISTNSKIMELLFRLYGRKAMPFQTLNFPVGTQQPYHSDSVHFSSFPERFMCGVWVALEDINLNNGPLMYFPGTHK